MAATSQNSRRPHPRPRFCLTDVVSAALGEIHNACALADRADADLGRGAAQGGSRMRRHELSEEEWGSSGRCCRGSRGEGAETTTARCSSACFGSSGLERTGAICPSAFQRMGERVRPVPPLAQRRHVRARGQGTTHQASLPGQVGLGPLVRGRQERAGVALRGKSLGKGARASPQTTRRAVHEADGERSCTWSLTVREFPSPRASAQGRRTSRGSSGG